MGWDKNGLILEFSNNDIITVIIIIIMKRETIKEGSTSHPDE